jgi:hypothetical protein
LRNFALTAATLAALGALVLALEMRGDVSPAGDRLAAQAERLAAQLDPEAPRAEREALLLGAGVAARQVGPGGGIRLQTGTEDLWNRTSVVCHIITRRTAMMPVPASTSSIASNCAVMETAVAVVTQ